MKDKEYTKKNFVFKHDTANLTKRQYVFTGLVTAANAQQN